MSVTREAVLAALAAVPGPDGRTPLPQSGALSEVIVHGEKVYFSIAVDPSRARELEGLRAAAEAAMVVLRMISAVARSG